VEVKELRFRIVVFIPPGLYLRRMQGSAVKVTLARRTEYKHSSYSFLTLALDGVSDQRHAPAELNPGERTTGTHWIGGWVGLTTG
jgi:hypothetical protein